MALVPTAMPLEIGKGAVPALGAQRIEAFSEEALVIHAGHPGLLLFWLGGCRCRSVGWG
jgi:hypothetical protein